LNVCGLDFIYFAIVEKSFEVFIKLKS